MALQHHLNVTSPDLDPAMIARASAHRVRGDRRVFLVGDVAALPSPTGTFDLVVSTLSLHHGADPTAGLGEIGCVLHPGGQALVWNVRPGACPATPMRLPPSHTRRARRCAWWRQPPKSLFPPYAVASAQTTDVKM